MDDFDGLMWNVVVMMPVRQDPDGVLETGPTATLFVVIYSFATVACVLNVGCIILLLCYWHTGTIKFSQPTFSLLVLCGGVLLSVDCFLLTGENTRVICILRPFLFNLPFTICMSTLLVKGWITYTKFAAMGSAFVNDPHLIKFPKLCLYVSMFVLADAFIMCLVIYGIGGPDGTGTRPITQLDLSSSGAYELSTHCRYVNNYSLQNAEIAFKGGLVLVSCVFAFLNRHIPGTVAGSRSMLLLVYTVAFIACIVIGVGSALTDIPVIITVQALGICLGVIMNAFLMVVQHLITLCMIGDDAASAQFHKSMKQNMFERQMSHLPIHSAIRRKLSDDIILGLIHSDGDTIYELVENRSVFDLAMEHNCSDKVMTTLMRLFLPFTADKEPVDAAVHCFAWACLAQSDDYKSVVETILQEYPQLCFLLAEAQDSAGRVVVNIASPACGELIRKATFFMTRFQMTTSVSEPQYKSATSVVHMGIDHNEDKSRVALKFIKTREDFLREVEHRHQANFSANYVIPVTAYYECTSGSEDEQSSLANEFFKHGFDQFSYCIVMPAGSRNLSEVLSSEFSDPMEFLKTLSHDLIKALHHIHEHGFIHGDVKPQNILRGPDCWTFVDLDSSAPIRSGFSGYKLRSAYAPPELIDVDEDGSSCALRRVEFDESGERLLSGPRLLMPALPSHDMWALGTVLFRAASGEYLYLYLIGSARRHGLVGVYVYWPAAAD